MDTTRCPTIETAETYHGPYPYPQVACYFFIQQMFSKCLLCTRHDSMGERNAENNTNRKPGFVKPTCWVGEGG